MVIGVPSTKCAHGVFKAGEPTAKYCGFCNPNMAFSAMPRTLRVELSKPDVEDELTLDCVEFMERNPGARLAALGR